MIVFYLKETGVCMLSIPCGMTEITVEDDKAYYNGAVVNNNMTKYEYAEVPEQPIYTKEYIDGEWMRIRKTFSELEQGPVPPSDADRIAALENVILELLGGA